jgi:hypothetical protein
VTTCELPIDTRPGPWVDVQLVKDGEIFASLRLVDRNGACHIAQNWRTHHVKTGWTEQPVSDVVAFPVQVESGRQLAIPRRAPPSPSSRTSSIATTRTTTRTANEAPTRARSVTSNRRRPPVPPRTNLGDRLQLLARLHPPAVHEMADEVERLIAKHQGARRSR